MKFPDATASLYAALDEPFHDVGTTRRSKYRALYLINDDERIVTVLAVGHRRDAYRPR